LVIEAMAENRVAPHRLLAAEGLHADRIDVRSRRAGCERHESGHPAALDMRAMVSCMRASRVLTILHARAGCFDGRLGAGDGDCAKTLAAWRARPPRGFRNHRRVAVTPTLPDTPRGV